MPRTLVGALLLCSLLARPAAAADPASDQLFFTGSKAAGQNTLSFANNAYTFTFSGDETIAWKIDLSDPKVAGGQLRVRELSSDSYPIDTGGVAFRDAAGAITYPNTLYKKTTLTAHSMSDGVVRLDYLLTLNGTHPYRFEFSAQGKQLRIRATSLDGSTQVADNLSGLAFMKSTGIENPVPIRMQGALAHAITMFRHEVPHAATEHWFTANMLDMFQSNASDYRPGPIITPEITADSITSSFDTATKYEAMTNGHFAAPLDDAFILVVSSRIRDVLLDSTAPPSPYRSLLASRMVFDGPAANWANYDKLFDAFLSYGMYNLAGYFFFDWTASAVDTPSAESVGPDWLPAFDAANFQSMLNHGLALGHVLGTYTAFNCMPDTAAAPIWDPSHVVRDGLGVAKKYPGLGFPLMGVEACGLHAAAETAKLNELGANMVFLDIQTFGSISKGPDGGHLDQNAGSPWAKTMRQGYVGQKAWFDAMRTTLSGPLLGEGSIGTVNANFEYTNYGYVDSTQRVINTGGSGKAALKPPGSPYAPTNWQIIPEYEWRIANQRQVNHGNGFHDRFFGPSDGPTVVKPDGWPIFPLTQDALDLYQAFLVTYGHAGFVVTNGTDSPQDLIRYADMAQTYFLTNALQSLYFGAPIARIRYLYGGSWKTFEQIVFVTETLDTFRHIPVRLDFQSGLRIYANHGETPLVVTDADETYTLPPRTGWWAGLGGGWFLAFSGSTSGTGGQRIDYCRAPGQYEYFNGRGAVAGFGNITTDARRRKWTVAATNVTVTEDASGTLVPSAGDAPAFGGLLIVPGDFSLGAGERTGLKAIAWFANGGLMDLTTMLDWVSTKPGVAKVTDTGILTAGHSGTAKIVALGFGGALMSTPITVTVP